MEQKKTVRAEGAVKRMSTSTVAFLLAAVLIFGCAVGGTLAWLTGKAPEKVVNTFVLGNINLSLSQGVDPEGNPIYNFQHQNFVAGSGAKPVPASLVVGADSAKSFVYLVIEESADFQQVATYRVKLDNWAQLGESKTNTNGVKTTIYYTIHDGEAAKTHQILQGRTYPDGEVEAKATFGTVSKDSNAYITFYGFAIQYDGIATGTNTSADAKNGWEKLVDTFDEAANIPNPFAVENPNEGEDVNGVQP